MSAIVLEYEQKQPTYNTPYFAQNNYLTILYMFVWNYEVKYSECWPKFIKYTFSIQLGLISFIHSYKYTFLAGILNIKKIEHLYEF